MQDDITNAKKELSSLTTAINQCRLDIETQVKLKEDAEKATNEAVEKQVVAEKNLANTTVALDEETKKLQDVQVEYSKVQNQVNEAVNELASIKRDIAFTAERSNETIEDLTKERKQELVQVEQSISDAKVTLEQTKTLVAHENDAYTQTQERYKHLGNIIAENQNNIADQIAKLEESREIIAELDKQIVAKESKKSDLGVEIGSMTESYAVLQKQIVDAQGTITELNTEIEKLKESDITKEWEQINHEKFVLGERLADLDTREEMVRSKFREAGVPW